MLHAPDGRLRLRNVLSIRFSRAMTLLWWIHRGHVRHAGDDCAVCHGVCGGDGESVLPDVREFIRGTVNVMENLFPTVNWVSLCQKSALWLTVWIYGAGQTNTGGAD